MSEENQKNEIKLTVAEARRQEDVGRSVARVSKRVLDKLGIKQGDVIEIEGSKKTGAIARSSYREDEGLDIIRLDGLERQNVGASIGEKVSIREADVREAERVTIAPTDQQIRIRGGGNALKRSLLGRPASKGDLITPTGFQQKVQWGTDSIISQFFGDMFQEAASPSSFGLGEIRFMVTDTKPGELVLVTRKTKVNVSSQPVETGEVGGAPNVTYEDIGGLEKEIQRVREMVELPLRHPELFDQLGIEPPKGVLLHGPPGTGKTLTAKAVANESDAYFQSIAGPEIMCVAGDTKILTNPEGSLKAEDIYKSPGEVENHESVQTKALEEPIKTYGFDGNEIVESKITHAIKMEAPSYSIKLDDGNEFTVSHNQPFLVYEEGELKWKRVSDLEEDEFVARINNVETEERSYQIPLEEIEGLVEREGKYALESKNLSTSNFIKLPEKTSPELLEFLGFLVSEGNIHGKKDGITLCNSEERLKSRFKELFKNLFGVSEPKEYKSRITVYSKLLVEYLELLGFSKENKLTIPGYFYKLPKKQIQAFVKGYTEGDGTVSIVKTNNMEYPTPYLYAKDKDFLEDLQSLMQVKLNISAKIKKHNTPKGKMFRLVPRGYEGRKEFSRISSEGPKFEKINEIDKVKRVKEFENVPLPTLLLEDIREKLPYKEYRNHDYYVYGRNEFTKHALERLYEIAEENGIVNQALKKEFNLLTRDDIAWQKIEKIEQVGRKELYDFTADKDSFTAGLYLMHNSKFYGESEKKLRNIFEEAKKNAPSIIFIDELDAIASKREETTGDVEKRVVSQLLSLLDGLEARGKIIVIAATNRVDAVDPALRRPGRFDREIEIGVPSRDGRKEILQIHTRGMPLSEDVDVEELADNTHGYVGADLAALAREAAMNSLREILPEIDLDEKSIPPEILDNLKVTKEHFRGARQQVEPSAMREVLIQVPDTNWEDIGGLEDMKQQLQESVEWPLKNSEAFDRVGIEAPNGVLLYGPPGTGKTMLARAVATESDANFISIKGPELLSKWVGESEKAVRETFKKARQAAPAVIFFDEIDAMVPKRGMRSSGSQVGERVISQLLTELDGLEELEDVVVIGATNRPDLVDPALLRPGRFDRVILAGAPDLEAREEIFRIHTERIPLADGVDLAALAQKTGGYSGADIAAVCKEAGMLALREDIETDEVKMEHFEKAMESVGASITDEISDTYKEFEKEHGKEIGEEVKEGVGAYY